MKTLYSTIAVLLTCHCASAEPPVRPGDRIAIVGNTFADQLRIHGYLETLLLQHTKGRPVSIRNLGWGGDMLTARDRPTGFPTEESTLTANKTDVVIACFGMGESFAGSEGLTEFKKDLEGFIANHSGKKYNGESDVRLILVSPIAVEDLGKLTPQREKRNEELKAYTDVMREVAETGKVPFVNLFAPSLYVMNEDEGPNLTTNGIHLNSFGYWAMSRTFHNHLVGTDTQPWSLRVDAMENTAVAIGVDISDVISNPSGVRFKVKETSAPSLPPPTDQHLPPQLMLGRDTLAIDGLKPGTYQLTIDKQVVAAASAEDWAKGMPVDNSPAHKLATKYRAAVNDKNAQFTYSWKALNQVHIVGERRSSPSGGELPKEVIKFNEIAIQRDEALSKGVELKTRVWQLSLQKNH